MKSPQAEINLAVAAIFVFKGLHKEISKQAEKKTSVLLSTRFTRRLNLHSSKGIRVMLLDSAKHMCIIMSHGLPRYNFDPQAYSTFGRHADGFCNL